MSVHVTISFLKCSSLVFARHIWSPSFRGKVSIAYYEFQPYYLTGRRSQLIYMMPKSVYITVIYCEDLGMTEWARLCTHALTFICIPWFAMHAYIYFFHAITCITVAQQPGLHTTYNSLIPRLLHVWGWAHKSLAWNKATHIIVDTICHLFIASYSQGFI